ncbi:hypothetical protein DFQ27_008762 [Actinomortierella ambigua]|uniref:TATA element modulatory factor 1 TATA binding domain-containing protein n=1 Tax=Actinomortierella ambigua TaxID=1343610 RepID=A0A9P6TYE4_9FUNG|nr:hypothetical protein DFQ27_008762 [Actinomortierella ambigua]
MSFFGSTQGPGGSSPGSGQSNPNSSANSWGSFLKQGLSQIESKLDKVLDMQVPTGGSLSAFSPQSMSALLSSPEGLQQGGGEKAGSAAIRGSTDSRRSNVERSARPLNDNDHDHQQQPQGAGSADAAEGSSSRSASPNPGMGLPKTGSARQSQDLSKSTSLRQAAQQHAGGDGGGRVSTSGDSGSRVRPQSVSVEVDPVTGMVTAAPVLRVMSPSPLPSAGTSPASAAAAAAATAAAAHRERLENRMRGIFKKPAASATSPGSNSNTGTVRSSTEGQSSATAPSSASPSTSATPSRIESPAPALTPQKGLQASKDETTEQQQQQQLMATSPESVASDEGDHLHNNINNNNDNNDHTPMIATRDSASNKEDEPTIKSSVHKEASITSGKDVESNKGGDEDIQESCSTAPEASVPQVELADVDNSPTETPVAAEKDLQDDAETEKEGEEEDKGDVAAAVVSDTTVAEQQVQKDNEPLRTKEQEDRNAVQDDVSVDNENLPQQESAAPKDVKEEEELSVSVSTEDKPLSTASVELSAPEEASVEPTQDSSSSEAEGEEEKAKVEEVDKSPSEEKETSAVSSHEDHSTPAMAQTAASSTTSTTIHPAEAHLVKVIEQREEQLFKVMQEHSQLIERHRDLEDAKIAEQQLLNNKISGLEGIIEQQKKELDMARSAAATTAGTPKSTQRTLDEQKRLLEEKDEQIRGLLGEGEILSKKEFKNLTTIKTLRAKNIESEKAQQDLQQKLEKTQANYMEAQAKVSRLTEEQRQLNDMVRSLTEQNNRQSKQISKLESDINQMREDKANLQLGLDRAWQELEDARKASNEMSAQAQQAAVEHERKVNEELQEELASIQREHQSLVAQLRQEIQDLRVSLSNRDETAGELEDQLRAEIQGLQWRLEQTDGDAYEMQEAIEEARRPLQRQLESIQAQHYASTRNWERIEKQLTGRVHDAEDDLLKAQSREKAAKEKLDSMKTQVVGFEARLDTLRSADTQLRTELSATKRQCLEKDEALRAAQAELTKERQLRERSIEEAKEDESRRSKLALQDEMEKLKMRVKQLQQQLAAKEEQAQQQQQQQHQHQQSWVQDRLRRESSSSINTPNGGGVQGFVPERSSFDSTTGSVDGVALSRSNSMIGMMAASSSKMLPSSPPPMGSPSLLGLSGASGSGSPAVAIERLSSMVRHLEGQVAFLNEQVRTSSKHKDDLSEELVKVSVELESLQEAATRVPALEQELKQLEGRHAAALELLGEKTEEVQELKADLADVREAYRDQLNELLGQLEGYRKNAA